MSRLKALLHVAHPSTRNTQQTRENLSKPAPVLDLHCVQGEENDPSQSDTVQQGVHSVQAVAQHTHSAQQKLLHVARPSNCNTQQPASDADKAAETRRQRVLAMLAERPGTRYAVAPYTDADPGAVIVAVAIRGVGTCELRIPRQKWDPFLFLEAVERHAVQ